MTQRAERSVRLVLIASLLLSVPLFLLRDHVAYAAPAAAPAQQGQVVHVVRAGETLHSIARRYGTTVGAIALANGITNANVIYAGQRLVIPGASGQAPPAPRPATRRPAATGGGCPDRYALLQTTEGVWQCFIADPFFFIIDERGRRKHWNAYYDAAGRAISWTRVRKYALRGAPPEAWEAERDCGCIMRPRPQNSTVSLYLEYQPSPSNLAAYRAAAAEIMRQQRIRGLKTFGAQVATVTGATILAVPVSGAVMTYGGAALRGGGQLVVTVGGRLVSLAAAHPVATVVVGGVVWVVYELAKD